MQCAVPSAMHLFLIMSICLVVYTVLEVSNSNQKGSPTDLTFDARGKIISVIFMRKIPNNSYETLKIV